MLKGGKKSKEHRCLVFDFLEVRDDILFLNAAKEFSFDLA